MFGAPPNGSTFFSFSGPTIAVELFLDLILNTDPLRPLFYLNEIIYSKKYYFKKKIWMNEFDKKIRYCTSALQSSNRN